VRGARQVGAGQGRGAGCGERAVRGGAGQWGSPRRAARCARSQRAGDRHDPATVPESRPGGLMDAHEIVPGSAARQHPRDEPFLQALRAEVSGLVVDEAALRGGAVGVVARCRVRWWVGRRRHVSQATSRTCRRDARRTISCGRRAVAVSGGWGCRVRTVLPRRLVGRGRRRADPERAGRFPGRGRWLECREGRPSRPPPGGVCCKWHRHGLQWRGGGSSVSRRGDEVVAAPVVVGPSAVAAAARSAVLPVSLDARGELSALVGTGPRSHGVLLVLSAPRGRLRLEECVTEAATPRSGAASSEVRPGLNSGSPP
jgi:hypothetical protein